MSKVRTASRPSWAGILISTTTSLTMLAGCWGGQPAPVAPAVPSAAPVQPVASPAQPDASLNELKGRAMLNGQPLANATLMVYDAVSDKPLGNIIAAGGGNFGVTADSFKTDAEGNFSIGMAGFTSGKVAKIVANTDKGSLALVVGAVDLAEAKQLRVQQAAVGAGSSSDLLLNEVSTAIAQVADGPLKMAATLKPEAAFSALKDLLVKLATEVAPKIDTAFKKDPKAAADLIAKIDTQGKTTDSTGVVDLFAKSGVADTLKSVVNTLITAVAAIAKDPTKVDPKAPTTKTIDFLGTGLKMAVSGTTLTLTDSKTGTVTTINVATSTTTTTTTTPPASGGSGGGSSSSVSFNPTATFQTNANFIRLKVQQAAGQSDIASLVVRVPVAAAIGATTINNLNLNNPSGSITGAGGQIVIGSVGSPVMSLGLNVVPSANKLAGTLDFSGMPSAPFGSMLDYAQGIENQGTLQVPNFSNAVLGNVRVLTGNSSRWWAASNIYVAAKYVDQPAFHNATSLITTNGHTSSLDFLLPAGITFTNSQALNIQVYVTPRSGSASARTVTATYDPSTLVIDI